ncbi:MAG: gliding motility-associated C-terminal domain-containing protein [Saprospiraceae bacterium]|nr:gliding motility-associated C-terminal domain-containing protein [Candidatus Opimibacter iunctus]
MKSSPSILFAVLLLLPLSGFAQIINDCSNAQVVCDDSDLAFNPDGPGLDDFADPDNDQGCITALEQNSAWYYFQIDPSCPPGLELGFIIHPKGGLGEDYDWALFGPNVECGDLGSPLRCSSSSAACQFCPDTGMGMGTTDFTEGPGTGDGFVSTITVQPGQGYYLMIDNWLGTTNGFVLTWTDPAAPYLNCNASPPCALYAVAGNDIFVCEGETSVDLDGNSTGNHGNETYSWTGTNGGTAFLSDPNSPSTTVNLPPGFTGNITYTLTVAEDTCSNGDPLELTVVPLPDINITQIGPFCANTPPQALSATPPGGTWSGDNTGNTFNPILQGPGSYTVTYTYTDSHNCTNSESLDIEVNELPTVEITPDPAEFCQNTGSVQLTAEGSDGAGGYTYNWNTPSGTGIDDTYDATTGGLHNVTVTDANGCKNTTSINVTVYQNPDVEIIDPGPICESLEYFQLDGNPNGGTFSGPYVSPDGELIPNTINPGTYQISYDYIDNHGCEATTVQNITIIPTPNAFAENNTPVCQGQPILLNGTTDGTGATVDYLWTGPNGYTSTSQNPTDVTEGGFYSLEVSVDGCPSAAVFTNVIVTDMPDAVALNGGPYCIGQNIQLLASTSAPGPNITYAWSGPGGYTSDVQNPSDATLPGTYSLIVTVGSCASDIATTDVIFSAPPDAIANNTGPYCAGEAIALSGNTTSAGTVITYTWSGPGGYSSSNQNPTDATTAGVYNLVVTVDGCGSSPTPTIVNVNALPQPVITGQASFCTGFSSTLDAGAGYMSYVWDDASINQTREVFSSGTYHVTVTDNNGCTGQATFTASEIPSLSPVITGALEFCEGSGTTLDAGAGYMNYTWSTGETSQTIQVTTAGNVGVLVVDSDGCSGSANITTIEHLNPVITIGGSTTYCIGGSTVLDAGAGYTSYTWNNSALTQTITVSTPGTYSVDVIDTYGCAGSGSVSVDESTSLHPVITGNTSYCENGSTTLNAGSGFATYLWSDGSMNQNLVVNAPGTYAVTVTDGGSCMGDSSITVNEVLPPSAVVQGTTQLCNTIAGGSVINLYDLVLSGDMNGTWQDADQSGAVGLFTNLNFNNIPAGDYTFIYTTNSAIAPCPEATYQAVVTVLDCTCPDVLFFNAAPLCNGGDILDLNSIENTTEQGAWSLIQTPPGSNPGTLTGTMFNAAGGDPGQYTFQYSLLNQPPPGCPLDYQATVEVDMVVDAGIAAQPVAYCSNEDQVVSLATLISGADINGTWSETSTSPSSGAAFNPGNATFKTKGQQPGTYSFQYALVANGACPGDASTVSVVIYPLPIVTVADFGTLDCVNTTQRLDATGSSSGPGFTIAWTGPGILIDGNENTLRPTIDKPGKYILTITNTVSGCKDTSSVTVIQNTAAPSSALITDQNPSCFGDQNGLISIDQVIGGTPPYLSSLNNAPFAANSVYTNLTAGDYTLALQDATGCLWDTSLVISEPSEISIALGPDIELGLGESATVEATINLPTSQMDTLIWTPDGVIECFDINCLQGTVYAANTVTLSATVYDEYGCPATDNILITVSKDRRVYIPNAFSPNGDGVNDLFFVSGDLDQIVSVKKFQVYNRWGSLLHEASDFQPNDESKGWDGTFNSELLNPGVFVYTAEVEFIDGVTKIYTGDVTLIK